MHPEVVVSLLTLQYSGITQIGLRYSIYRDIVKKLNQRVDQQVTKALESLVGTSETLCNEIIQTENIKEISIHRKYSKPLKDEEIGHYLAGLIDGEGHWSSACQLVIKFNRNDKKLAYWVKEKIGYGQVYFIKDKEVVNLIISKKEGISRVIRLVNGKMRLESKLKEIEKNILSNKERFSELNSIKLELNCSESLVNHWLAGYTDAEGSFQIKVRKKEVRLNYQIDKKTKEILVKIKEFLGGNIGLRKDQEKYDYGSTSYGSARKVIKYFEEYNLMSSKYINYLKFRKVYIMIQKKEHLTEKGLEKIKKISII